MDMLVEYGLLDKTDKVAEMRQAADETMNRISTMMQRSSNVDSQDVAARLRDDAEE